MLSNKAIERFKASSLEEKREVISLYFNAYKQAMAKKISLGFTEFKKCK